MRNPLLLIFLATTLGCGSDAAPSDAPEMAASADQAVAHDLAVPSDLRAPIDMTDVSDMTLEPDMAQVPQCAMHDPTNASCDDLSTWIHDWLTCYVVCSNDADCGLVSAYARGMCLNPCDVVASSAADGPYLQSLNDAYAGNACGSVLCFCSNPGNPTCAMGKCAGL